MNELIETLPVCPVTAYNYASASANRVHDEETAVALGYAGALVPGVAIFAYLARPVMAAHGRCWLEGGRLSASFRSPVYDGRTYTARGKRRAAGDEYELELASVDGTLCATGAAARLRRTDPLPEASTIKKKVPCHEPLEPTVEDLVKGVVLRPVERKWTAQGWLGEFDGDFATQMGAENMGDLWHPAYPVYLGNALLMANVSLGLWIHIRSDVRYLRMPVWGGPVQIEGWVEDSTYRGGHVWTRITGIIRDGAGQTCAWLSHEALVRLAGKT